MKGKYCEYYWSVKKQENGKFAWFIRSDHKKSAKILQSSLDEEDENDKYYDNPISASIEVRFAIQLYYS